MSQNRFQQDFDSQKNKLQQDFAAEKDKLSSSTDKLPLSKDFSVRKVS